MPLESINNPPQLHTLERVLWAYIPREEPLMMHVRSGLAVVLAYDLLHCGTCEAIGLVLKHEASSVVVRNSLGPRKNNAIVSQNSNQCNCTLSAKGFG